MIRGVLCLHLKTNMLERISTIPCGFSYFPVYFPKVLHRHSIIAKSPLSCSVSKSNPSSLLINYNHTHGNVSGSKNSGTISTTSGDRHEDAPFRFPNNTVGIVGGISTASTLHFLQKFVEFSSQDGGEAIPFIVCNDPILNINNFHDPRSQKMLIVEKLRERRVFLEKCGACCIVMPCHSLQVWHEEIVTDNSVPFLHTSDCIVKELKAANLKPVEMGSNVRIGLLSSDSSLSTRFYQGKLQNEGFEVIYPDKATMEHAVIPAVDAVRRKDTEGARNLLRIAIQVLLVKAVNAIVFTSHNLSRILPPDDPLLAKCIDPMESLARETVRQATSIDPNVFK
ncbi:Aspartate racemase [Rhynchospora pubera]|uniref:Aspartate racemase n=1 Tax=Rhynchospora pubera TaxID=906938 RepID=A0AAV8C5B4_9POAL|nr:Aspartate racemase [Rhynchospora pubera]